MCRVRPLARLLLSHQRVQFPQVQQHQIPWVAQLLPLLLLALTHPGLPFRVFKAIQLLRLHLLVLPRLAALLQPRLAVWLQHRHQLVPAQLALAHKEPAVVRLVRPLEQLEAQLVAHKGPPAARLAERQPQLEVQLLVAQAPLLVARLQ